MNLSKRLSDLFTLCSSGSSVVVINNESPVCGWFGFQVDFSVGNFCRPTSFPGLFHRKKNVGRELSFVPFPQLLNIFKELECDQEQDRIKRKKKWQKEHR